MELLTTDAFATWFSSLDAAPAEDVAATLEVIVELGTRTEAPGSSELLLWYEHPLLSQRPLPSYTERFRPELVKFMQDWQQAAGYVKRVIKHLESPQLTARLARLSPKDAAEITDAVKRIRRMTTMRGLALSDFQVKHRISPLRALTAFESQKLASFADVSEIRDAYFATLAAAGFEVQDVAPSPGVLREISLRSTPPGLRILYGIDETKNRGLVVLGEWLDRSFYGDSVRRAEAVWARFLGGEPLSVHPAGPR
jgi:hypothetical protein